MAEYKTPYTGIAGWFDQRMPTAMAEYRKHLSEYYAPKNFNIWYIFGGLAITVLAIQIITGIFLVMSYKPDANLAFASVEYIMRDVPGGWFIRYMHSTGASFFFIVVYLHMFRGLMYGSYRAPRELVWIFGCLIFLCLMGEAFFGYLLPWGQMSYWGAQVIVNLFGAIPLIGPDLSIWIRGDYVIGDATLNRFFSFHVIAIPLVLIGLVAAHVLALHDVGSNNPDGVEIKKKLDTNGRPLDGIPFHPYYTVHDIFWLAIFLLVFFFVVFFAPEMGGYFLEWNNFVPADPLQTPSHIAPVWYFTPFYSILRATTEQFVVCACARHDRHVGSAGADRPQSNRARCTGRRHAGPSARLLHARPEVLGRRADGGIGDDLPGVAVARPVAGEVDAIPTRLALLAADRLGRRLCRARLLRHAAAIARRAVLLDARHGHLLRVLCTDAVVEPDGNVQAGPGPSHVPSALRAPGTRP